MKTAPLILLFAFFGSTLFAASASSDCRVDYSTGTLSYIGDSPIATVPCAVSVAGSFAYVAAGTSGLHIIDVSNPTFPRDVATIGAPFLSNATGVAVIGTHAYATDLNGTLQVVDISDPTTPAVVGSLTLPSAALGPLSIAVKGSFLYVPDDFAGLLVINVSNPTSPAIVSSVPAQDFGFYHVTISGSYACVSGWFEYSMLFEKYSGIRVIDISNPASPFIVGSLNNQHHMLGLTAFGSHLYVADADLGLQVIDISNPATPSLLSTLQIPGSAFDVAVSDSIAYVAGTAGVTAVVISNPLAPTLIGSASGSGKAESVVIANSLAYTGDRGLLIYELQCSDYVPPPPPPPPLPIEAKLIRTWGGYGTEPGEFDNPYGIAIDRHQDIYITDESNNRIQKFDSTGVFLTMWGTTGAGNGQLTSPTGIDVGADSLVYVSDHHNHRICVFTTEGVFVRNLLDGMYPPYLYYPVGLDAEPSGNLWVADQLGLHHLTPTGQVLQDITTENGAVPYGVTADGNTIFASLCGADQVDKYTLNPSAKQTIAHTDLECPEGSVLDSDGNLWFCDTGHDRIMKYDAFGNLLGTLQLPRVPRPIPSDITFDRNGDLYIIEWGLNQIAKYSLSSQKPTDVRVTDFRAQSTTEGVLLTWLVQETDWAVFTLERSIEPGAGFERITGGSLLGSSINRFLDRSVEAGQTYFYRLEAQDRSGQITRFGPISVQFSPPALITSLRQNTPNPFMAASGHTVIPFSLGSSQRVTLRVFDLGGRLVRTIIDDVMTDGDHELAWDGRDDHGRVAPNGIFVYRLETENFAAARRMVKLR